MALPGKQSVRQIFDLPPGPAEVLLKSYSEQTGLDLLFATWVTTGVRTKAVKGEFTQAEALNLMLADTGLAAVYDEASGVFTIQPSTPPPMTPPIIKKIRHALLGLVLSLSTGLKAQSDAPKEEKVIMSPFEVTSTKDKGYTSTNAATGFKTNEVLLQIPQAVTLVTRDLIDDIGYTDTSDALQFAGAVPFTARSEAVAIRGARAPIVLIDDVPDALPYSDTANIDSYTILRGPSSTLYLNTSIGGTVLITSKKPLPNAEYSINVEVDSEGLLRSVVDFTGPLGSLGDAKFSYRLVGLSQGGETFQKNAKDDRLGIYPTLQMAYHDTVVRLAVDYHNMDRPANANTFLKLNGDVYTGAGRDEGYYVPGGMENHEMTRVRFELLQKLSENWDLKVSAQDWTYWRLGSNVFPSAGINYPANTIGFTARANDRGDDFQTVLADVVGKYKFFGVPMQTAFGGAYARQSGESWIRATSTFGKKYFSLSDPQLDSIRAPRIGNKRGAGDAGDYPVVSQGGLGATYRGNLYAQQTVQVIPERLSVIGGMTFSKIKSNDNRSNTNLLDENELLHRLGVVFNPIKDVAIYAMESEMFSPQTRKDINDKLIGNQLGKGREIGVKTEFLEGKISSTISFFNLELSRQAAFGGVRPSDGVSYYAPLGTTTQKGMDMDLAISPLPGLQFVGSYYNGTVEDQAGVKVNNTYDQSISLFARYEIQGTHLEGLSFGGGYSRVDGREIGSGGVTTGQVGAPKIIKFQPGNNVSLFATYRPNRNWLLRANIKNVLDETFAVGAQAAWLVDVNPPRTYSLSATYTF